MRADGERDVTRQAEAWPPIGNPDQRIAEALTCELFTVLRAGEVIRRVGVGVVDVREGQEAMQQRLNRRTRTTRIEVAMR